MSNFNFSTLIKIFKNPYYLPWKIKTKYIRNTKNLFNKSHYLGTPNITNSGNAVMFHIGRSGSTLIDNMLSQHPSIHWDGELLKDTKLYTAEDPIYFDKIKLSMASLGKNRFYGFEVKPFHLSKLNITIPFFLEQINQLGFDHFVVLQRRNYLKKIISSLKASKTGEWHKPRGGKPLHDKITIDFDNVSIDKTTMPLIGHLENYDTSFTQLENYLQKYNYLWLTYEEDILLNPQIAYNKLVKFFSLKTHPSKVNYGRTNPFHISAIVSNYDALVHYLHNTQYAWMLSE